MTEPNIDLNEVPDNALLPDNLYLLEVEDLEATESKAGKFMYKATYRVVEGDYTGVPLFDYFAIGTDDDKQAQAQATWNASPAARRLKRLFKSCMVPIGSVPTMVETAKGQRFSARIGQEADRSTDPKYAGTPKNKIIAMYSVGAAPVSGASAPAPVSARQTAPAPGGAAAQTDRRSATGQAGKVTAPATVACPFCGDPIERGAKYAAHVRALHPEEA